MRVAVVTGFLAALTGITWIYLAPTVIGGNTAYIITHGISMEPLFHTGDLAIVRAASTYKVGEIVAYHSSLLHEVVLHRIVAIHGGRYVFKGDNNQFFDPVHPTRAELIGRLWIHLPHAGLVVERLRTPLGAGILAGGIGLVLVTFESDYAKGRRSRRPATTVPAERRVVKPVDSEGSRAAGLRDGLVVSGLAVVVFLALCLFAFGRPDRVTAKRAVPYRQQAIFEYSAAVQRDAVYPHGSVTTGDPIFLHFVRRLDVDLHYRLLAPRAADVSGTSTIAIRLSSPTGWSRTISLPGERHFVGGQFKSTAVIDLTSIQALLSRVENLTGIPSFDSTVAIVANVQLSGRLSGSPLQSRFSPILSFQLGAAQLQPESPSGTVTSSPRGLTDTQASSVTVLSDRANAVRVLGHSLGVRLIRILAVTGLVLSVLAALALGVLLRRLRRLGEPEQIEAQYRDLIVPLADGAGFADQEPVDLVSMEALVKLAHNSGQLVLHSQHDGADSYLVNDRETIYRYGVRDSETGGHAAGVRLSSPAAVTTATSPDAAPASASASPIAAAAARYYEHVNGNNSQTLAVSAQDGASGETSEANLTNGAASVPGDDDFGVISVTRTSAGNSAAVAEPTDKDHSGDCETMLIFPVPSTNGVATAASPTGDASVTGDQELGLYAALPTGVTNATGDEDFGVISVTRTGTGNRVPAAEPAGIDSSGDPLAVTATDGDPPTPTATSETSLDVTLPPASTVITHVKVKLKKRGAKFRFEATGNATGFECALVRTRKKKRAKKRKPQYEACVSSKTYKNLAAGRYIFYTRATGPGGPDPKPAIHKFRIA